MSSYGVIIFATAGSGNDLLTDGTSPSPELNDSLTPLRLRSIYHDSIPAVQARLSTLTRLIDTLLPMRFKAVQTYQQTRLYGHIRKSHATFWVT